MMSGSGVHDFTERKRRIDSVPMSFRCYVSLQGFVSFSLVEPRDSHSQVLLHDLYNHTQVFTPLN
jgi:hypothetical protein